MEFNLWMVGPINLHLAIPARAFLTLRKIKTLTSRLIPGKQPDAYHQQQSKLFHFSVWNKLNYE